MTNDDKFTAPLGVSTTGPEPTLDEVNANTDQLIAQANAAGNTEMAEHWEQLRQTYMAKRKGATNDRA